MLNKLQYKNIYGLDLNQVEKWQLLDDKINIESLDKVFRFGHTNLEPGDLYLSKEDFSDLFEYLLYRNGDGM
jgi:hypothetical protein